jgi:hypothetical protein
LNLPGSERATSVLPREKITMPGVANEISICVVVLVRMKVAGAKPRIFQACAMTPSVAIAPGMGREPELKAEMSQRPPPHLPPVVLIPLPPLP